MRYSQHGLRRARAGPRAALSLQYGACCHRQAITALFVPMRGGAQEGMGSEFPCWFAGAWL